MTPVAAPDRSDLRELEPGGTRWRPTLAVVAALAVVVGGGFLVTAGLYRPSDAAISVAGTVSVRPLSGWTAAAPDVAGLWTFGRLSRGTGTLDVGVRRAADQDPRETVATYLDEVLRAQLTRLAVEDRLERITLASGLVGVRFRYTGLARESSTSIEGEVAVVTSLGSGVVFDAWAPEGLLPFVLDDARAMIDRAAIA